MLSISLGERGRIHERGKGLAGLVIALDVPPAPRHAELFQHRIGLCDQARREHTVPTKGQDARKPSEVDRDLHRRAQLMERLDCATHQVRRRVEPPVIALEHGQASLGHRDRALGGTAGTPSPALGRVVDTLDDLLVQCALSRRIA